MIKTFKNRYTAAVFLRNETRKFGPNVSQVAAEKLRTLDQAANLDVLGLIPGNRLEALKGDRKGQFSIRINSQFRVCFYWRNGHAYEVEIVDYH